MGFLGANLWVGESLYVSTAFTGADMLEVVVALLLVPGVVRAAELVQPRQGIRFVAAAILLAPALSGLVAMSLLNGWFSNHPFLARKLGHFRRTGDGNIRALDPRFFLG